MFAKGQNGVALREEGRGGKVDLCVRDMLYIAHVIYRQTFLIP